MHSYCLLAKFNILGKNKTFANLLKAHFIFNVFKCVHIRTFEDLGHKGTCPQGVPGLNKALLWSEVDQLLME